MKAAQATFLILLFLFTTSFYGISQEENETIFQGQITQITKDSIISIKAEKGHYPSVGQEVKVYKLFKMFGGDGSVGVANAKVTAVTEKMVKVQVTLYTSTKVQEGKRMPLVKKGQIGQLRWEGGGKEIVNFNTKLKDAKALMADKEYEAAAEVFTELINDYNVDWTIYHYRGMCYFHLRKDEKALADLSKAIQEHAEDYQARLYRAFIFKRKDQYKMSNNDLTVLLEKANPKLEDKIFILQSRAYNKKELDEFKSAAEDMKKVLELDPGNTQAYNFIHQYGGENGPYDYPNSYSYHMTSKVLQQSKDGYTIVVKPTKDEEPCMFKEDDGAYATAIKVGKTATAFSCSEKSRMTICVMEVVSVEKDEVKLKVLFWSNSMNNVPTVYPLKEGSDFTFAWN